MKKTIAFVLLILLSTGVCSAGSVQDKLKAVVSAGGAAGCDPATQEIGDRTSRASAITTPGQQATCWIFTPECSGPLNTAYIQHRGTSNQSIKVALYSSAGSTSDPNNSSNVYLDKSGVISSSADELASSAMVVKYEVSSTTQYWLCTFSQTGFDRYYGATGVNEFVGDGACSDCQTTPPANLDVASTTYTSTANRQPWVFITIGP